MKYLTASLTLLAASIAAPGCAFEVSTTNMGHAAGMVAAGAGAQGGEQAAGVTAGGAVVANADSRPVASRVVTVVAVLLRAQTPRGEVRFRATRGVVTLIAARTLAAGEITGGTLVVSDEQALGDGRSRWTLGAGSSITLGGGVECAVQAGGELVLARSSDGVWAVADGRVTVDDPGGAAVGTATTSVASGTDAAVIGGGGAAVGASGGAAAMLVPADEPGMTSGAGVAVATGGAAAGGAVGANHGAASAGGASGGVRVTASVTVPALVQRISAGAAAGVILGGRVALAGVPDAAALEVVDGDVQFAPAGAAGAAVGGGTAWRATGGTLLVSARGGRRFRVRVHGGQIVVRASGRGTSGQTFWAASGGELTVNITAQGDASLALADAAPVAASGGGASAQFGTAVATRPAGAASTAAAPPAPRVMLSARALHALDALVHLAPAGSRAAMRQQAAVDLVVQSARSADALVYDTPVVGRSVVLVVDLSYSMSEVVPEFRGRSFDPRFAPTKLDIARAELVKVMASLPAGVSVSVVGFSSDLHTLWQQPRVVDDAALEAAIRWVAALRPLDETEPVAALRAAEAMRADQVVLISDGRPTQVASAEAALLSLADAIGRRGARLDAVGVGSDQDESFLATLTARGRGCARHW